MLNNVEVRYEYVIIFQIINISYFLFNEQTPCYWPWQHKIPDNMEYAIYLAKRTLRNKQRHALEDYEIVCKFS